MNTKIKWGIVGLGGIARKFATDLALIDDAELVAVASTSLDRAKDFAADYNVPNFYDNYEALFQDDTVEIIYIATVHQTHTSISIDAMNHNKHVLCEKPVAINTGELNRMISASQKNQVFFMEAFWTRFNPSIVKIKELIDTGEIGKLRYIHADFAFYGLDRDESSRLLNINLGGGSLLDIGIYPVFLSYLLLGMSDEIVARSKFFHTGAEVQVSIILDYKEAQALLYSGFAHDTEMKAKVCGEKGEIFINPRWHETQGFSVVHGGESNEVSLPTIGKGYAHEILEVHKCLNKQALESALWSHQNSRDLLKILDTIREKTGIKFPFEGK